MAGVYSNSTTGRVNTSGSQSGTHTALSYLYGNGNGSTTFNIPDLPGAVPRGAGTSSGYIQTSILTLGEKNDDQFQAFQVGMTAFSRDTFFGSSQNDFAYSSNVNSGTDTAQLSPGNQGVSGRVKAMNDGTNGTPRTGLETRAKSQAFNFYIKF
jgi:microcystin-dependent protein